MAIADLQTRIGHNASDEGLSSAALASANVTALNSTFSKVGVHGRAIVDAGGPYLVDDTLVGENLTDVEIDGTGAEIEQTASNTLCLSLTNCTNVRVKGFHFTGLGSDFTGTSGQSGTAVRIANCVGVEVVGNHIDNFSFAGVHLSGSSYCLVERNFITGIGRSVLEPDDNFSFGVYLNGEGFGQPGNRIINNVISDTAHGIQASSGWEGLTIEGNQIYNIWGQHGVYLTGVRETFVIGNRISNCRLDGIKMQLTSGVTGTPGQCIVRDNIISGNTQYLTDAAISAASSTLTSATASFTADDVGKSIYVNGAGTGGLALSTRIASVTNSTTVGLADAAATTVSGVAARYGDVSSWGINAALATGTKRWDGMTCQGNRVFDTMGGGITIRECDGVDISGNDVRRVANYGIYATSVTGRIGRNMVTESGWSGLYMSVPSGGRLEIDWNILTSPAVHATVVSAGASTEIPIFVTGAGTASFSDNVVNPGTTAAATYVMRTGSSTIIEMRRNRFDTSLFVRIETAANLTVMDQNHVTWFTGYGADGNFRVGHGARMFTGTAAPASGTYREGDKVWNGDLSPGAPIGWVCRVSGTPGTWEVMGQSGVATSVAGTPLFVGQIAVVSGEAYVATGTTGSGDWQQITP